MNKTNLVPYIIQQYRQGQRYFQDLNIEKESFEGQNLEDIIFENCSLYISFKKSKFEKRKIHKWRHQDV